jgi:hypothetical protein
VAVPNDAPTVLTCVWTDFASWQDVQVAAFGEMICQSSMFVLPVCWKTTEPSTLLSCFQESFTWQLAQFDSLPGYATSAVKLWVAPGYRLPSGRIRQVPVPSGVPPAGLVSAVLVVFAADFHPVRERIGALGAAVDAVDEPGTTTAQSLHRA